MKPTGATGGRGTGWWIGGVVLVLAVVAVWYFAVYDTAEGKCNRGDLGACMVVLAKQSAAASASAAVVSASAAVEAASAEASSFATSGCTVGPGDNSHDVRITVSDTASASVQQDACQQLVQSGWAVATDVEGAPSLPGGPTGWKHLHGYGHRRAILRPAGVHHSQRWRNAKMGKLTSCLTGPSPVSEEATAKLCGNGATDNGSRAGRPGQAPNGNKAPT